MKKENILLIVLGIVVIIGGVWFLTRDEDDIDNAGVVDSDEIIEEEEPEEDTTESSDEEEIESSDEDTAEPSDESSEDEVTESQEADIAVDAPAPDFTLENLAGESVSLSDYEGKIVLLNFWATWCGYCDQEMPDLNKFDKEYEDVVVLAVDVMEEKSEVEDYIEDGGYEFEVVLDIEGEVAKTYLIGGYPTSYFIEEDGRLIGRVQGPLEYEQMKDIIEQIKSER